MSNLKEKLKTFWQQLGPGLITGAADNDPSGIATYSIAGAKFGLAALWTAVVTLPFMIVTQRMASRIGLISGRGLAGNMKKFYPRWILIFISSLMIGANVINIGADISAMTAATELLVPQFPPILFSVVISAFIIFLLIVLPYHKIAHYLKWVAMVMFSFVLAAFLIEQDWLQILRHTFIPKIIFDKEYLMIIVAVFGTTISPYLYFWQASEAIEEEQLRKKGGDGLFSGIPGAKAPGQRSERLIKNEISYMYKDVGVGMFFSNMLTFFIIILSASTLFKAGVYNVKTIEEVASALKPLAGQYSNLLFLVGILAAGILAIPVLAGSAAYILSEIFNWRWGFENKFKRAKAFYLVIIIATALGILIPVLKLHPVEILFYTAVIFGAISPFLLAILIHMANNPKIMGVYTSRPHSNIIAYILLLIMLVSVSLMIFL